MVREDAENRSGKALAVRLVELIGSNEFLLVLVILGGLGLAFRAYDNRDVAHSLFIQLILLGMSLSLGVKTFLITTGALAEPGISRLANAIFTGGAAAALLAMVVVQEAGLDGFMTVSPGRSAENFSAVLRGHPVKVGLGFRVSVRKLEPATGSAIVDIGPSAGRDRDRTFLVVPGSTIEYSGVNLSMIGLLRSDQDTARNMDKSGRWVLAVSVRKGPTFAPVWFFTLVCLTGLGLRLFQTKKSRGPAKETEGITLAPSKNRG